MSFRLNINSFDLARNINNDISPVKESQSFDGQVFVVRKTLSNQVILERMHDHILQVWNNYMRGLITKHISWVWCIHHEKQSLLSLKIREICFIITKRGNFLRGVCTQYLVLQHLRKASTKTVEQDPRIGCGSSIGLIATSPVGGKSLLFILISTAIF